MSASWPRDVDVLDVVGDWIRSQRWFPAGELDPMEVVANVDLSADSAPEGWDPGLPLDPVWISLVRVGQQILQVPLVLTDVVPEGGRGVIARIGDSWVVDGPQHPAFLRAWVRRSTPDVLDGTEDPRPGLLAQADRARLMTGEQSNSSVVCTGDPAAVLKIYRVVSAGTHPDLEVPLALTRSGWMHVPAPLAHTELTVTPAMGGDPGHPVQAMTGLAARLVPDATDGFDLFVSMARDHLDPSAHARELGRITAQMHSHLASAFGEGAPAVGSTLAERVRVNLEASAAEVHELHPLVGDLESLLAPVGDLEHLPPTIRIHGDYHLGQTMFGNGSWYVLDFEGEPLRPLEDRRRRDLSMRDVAGMLRSFDYAAAQASRTTAHSRPTPEDTAEMPSIGASTPTPAAVLDEEWARAARDSFVAGYTDGHGFDAPLGMVLRALLIEKAAYEVVYEHRLRPSWLGIPLSALVSLARQAHAGN